MLIREVVGMRRAFPILRRMNDNLWYAVLRPTMKSSLQSFEQQPYSAS